MNGGYGHSFFRSTAMVIPSGFELVAASFTPRRTRLAAASRCLTLFPPLADTQSGDLPPTAGAQVQNAAARRPRPTLGVRRSVNGGTNRKCPADRAAGPVILCRLRGPLNPAAPDRPAAATRKMQAAAPLQCRHKLDCAQDGVAPLPPKRQRRRDANSSAARTATL